MAKKATEKKVAKKRVAKKKSDTVPTRKVQNRCEIKANDPYIEFVKVLRNKEPPEKDYNKYYGELDIDRPNRRKDEDAWDLPNQNTREWAKLPHDVRQLNYKPTANDLMDKPNYFSVMELAKKYPEQRVFFFVLAKYMESTGTRLTILDGVLSKARRGEKLTFEDGMKLQWACDRMLDDFAGLRKAVKKAKE